MNLSKSKIAFWSLSFLVTIAAAPFLFSRFSGGFEQFWKHISVLSTGTWSLLAVLVVAFYALDYFRYLSLLSVLGHQISPRQGFRLTCASYFVSLLTPVAELHPPVMIYLLTRMGVPGAKAAAATLTKSIYVTLWICIISLTCLQFDPQVKLPPLVEGRLTYLLMPLMVWVGILAAIAFFPNPLHRWAEQQRNRLPVHSLRKKIVNSIDHSARELSKLATSAHHMHFFAHLFAITFVLVYVAIGYLIARGVGMDLSPLHALTAFSTGLMIFYLAPIPGSIGVTELGTQYLLDPSMQPISMAVALLHRILCCYIVVIPGALLLSKLKATSE